MKKTIGILTAICVAAALWAACATGEEKRAVVALDGSTSMERIVGFLSESFEAENEGIKITYNPTGSSAGISAVLEGTCDIGLSSRELKEEEKAKLKSTVLALDGIAVAVNPKNSVSDLSLFELGAIYRGEIKNWSALGGEDRAIVLIGREAASGTRDGFEELTNTKNLCKYSQELTSTGDVLAAVSQNPNAIGYISLASISSDVKVLKIDGVLPSEKTIKSGEYKISRSFNLVTLRGKALSKEAEVFYEYAVSSEAAEVIKKAGAIPADSGEAVL